MTQHLTAEALCKDFLAVFGQEADQTFFSPGRINLIGEHTDYNGGHVFPAAISLGTYGAARKRDDQVLRFYSANFEEKGIIEVPLTDLKFEKEHNWTNYPKGVLHFLQEAGHVIDKGLYSLFMGISQMCWFVFFSILGTFDRGRGRASL